MGCKIQEIKSQALARLCEISRENIYKDKLDKIIYADLLAIEEFIFIEISR